jgi:two-component system cell cycle sensor histidine kinase/response regulator CckA
MKDARKTKAQLISELVEVRQRIAELEASETERKRAQEMREHLNLVLRAIRSVNQLITRERDRDRLLQGACDNLIETRGYHNAWIALIDETGGLVMTAEAGLGKEFLPVVEQLKRGELTDCARRALGQAGVLAIEDPLSTCTDCLLSGMYAGRGAMAVRLQHGGKVYGLMSISIPRDLVADEEEHSLFTEVAGDIAFALHNIEVDEGRKRAEEALREAEQEKAIILDSLSELVTYQDRELGIIWANRAAGESVCLSADELVGRHCYEIWQRRSEPCIGCPVMKALETGEPHEAEMTTPDERVWSIRGYPVQEEDGDIVGAVEVTLEITERKQAEETLRESEQRLKEAQAMGRIGNWGFDMDSQTIEWSDQVFELYERDPALGPPTPEEETTYYTPEQAEILREYAQRAIETGEELEYDLQAKLPSGRIAYFWASMRPIKDESGRVVRLFGTVQDITERRRAERLLRALNEAALAMERAITHEEIFAAMTEEFKKLGFSCAVFLTDESQRRLFPKYLSYESRALKAAEKLVGLKHEDFSIPIKAVDLYRKMVWEKRAVFVESVEDIAQQLLPESVKRFAGQMAKMLKVPKSIPAPLIVEDKVIGVLSVQSDDLTEDDIPTITAFAHQMAAAWHKATLLQELERSLEELKKTQVQLIQLQKMEAIGQLAAGIAHDFNNLLTPIGGFADLLLEKAREGSKQQEYLRQIRVAAERAAALTGRLRLFTRHAEGKRRPVQLNSVVEQTRALLERSIPKEITIELRLESELWVVEADSSQISQVLVNLCVNARDAMPDGGTLTLETRSVTLDEEYARMVLEARPGRYVCLSVSDTGCGMSAEVQARLFEPFFTTKEVGQGTGLGLSVVYGIVKGHNGFINVYSREGRGSTLHVYLPAIESAVEEKEVEGLELPTGTETILLVDDEEMLRALGQAVLEPCGYTVLMAEDGVQALEVYQAHRGEIALVVLDVIMPQMDGQECLRRLRELAPQVRVLISTGYTARGLAQELVAEGALGVVEKPFRIRDFAVAVRAALDES